MQNEAVNFIEELWEAHVVSVCLQIKMPVKVTLLHGSGEK